MANPEIRDGDAHAPGSRRQRRPRADAAAGDRPPRLRAGRGTEPPRRSSRRARALRARCRARRSPIASRRTTFTAPDGVTLPYRLLPPPSPPGARRTRVPLVLLLHGSGEIGTDNRAQLTPFALAWATRRGARPRRAPSSSCRRCRRDRPPTRARPTGDARTSEGTPLVGATLALVDRARRHAADRSPADRRRRLLDGRVDDVEPAARAARLLQRGDPDRRRAAGRSGRPRSGRRRGSG